MLKKPYRDLSSYGSLAPVERKLSPCANVMIRAGLFLLGRVDGLRPAPWLVDFPRCGFVLPGGSV